MTPHLLICIACHNRRSVAELCLPTMRDAMHADDSLCLYNDASKEYDAAWLGQFGPVVDIATAIGIQRMRQVHLQQFLLQTQFTHLYLTDHDCIHDPSWREHGLRIQAKYEQRPLGLYNTPAHADMAGNTISDNPKSEVIWRRFAPGVSYLLTREHVERLAPHIDTMQHFDWQIPTLIGPFATSRVSYLDHVGVGGQRHPPHEGADGGDRALFPTPWLVAKRAEVVAKLKEAL